MDISSSEQDPLYNIARSASISQEQENICSSGLKCSWIAFRVEVGREEAVEKQTRLGGALASMVRPGHYHRGGVYIQNALLNGRVHNTIFPHRCLS